MAFGSVIRARQYVNKVFNVEGSLARLTDGRIGPTVPFAAVMTTWFWGMVKQLPSTERVGDLLLDERWRKILGLKPEDGGSADSAGRTLDELSIEELNELQLVGFFQARRAGILKDDGPYGHKCVIVDLNELFTSEKIHCPECQVREKEVADADGQKRKVKEYFHQAVALVWAGGEVAWPINWELLAPGEGELTAAYRLLSRVLPRLRGSVDFVMGDALYCCRPFFKLVRGEGLHGLAIASGQTEMDEEIALLQQSEVPTKQEGDLVRWELESEAWEKDVGCKLRVVHFERRYEAKPWKHERRQQRVVMSAPIAVMPSGQGWKVSRCRWKIENGTFNILTRDYSLEHNYRHSTAAITALLVLRSLAYCVTFAYRRYATARTKSVPGFLRWFELVFVEDWVRYLDGALAKADPLSG
jgi:hypothetical protein